MNKKCPVLTFIFYQMYSHYIHLNILAYMATLIKFAYMPRRSQGIRYYTPHAFISSLIA